MNTTHLCNRCLITEVYKVDHEFKLALRELLPVSVSSPRKWDLTSLSPPLPQPSTCKYRTKTTFVLTGSKFEYLGMRRQDTASTHSLIIGKQRTTQAQSTALQVLFHSPQYWDLARCGKFQSPTNHLWSMWLTASTKVCSNTSVTLYSFNIFFKIQQSMDISVYCIAWGILIRNNTPGAVGTTRSRNSHRKEVVSRKTYLM